MKNGFVNNRMSDKTIDSKIEFIKNNSIHTVYRKDVLDSKNQSKSEKIFAINRHIANVGYNLPSNSKISKSKK